MTNIIKQSFKLIITILRVAGLYPSKQDTLLSKIKTYCFYSFFIVLIPALTLVDLILQEDANIMRMNFMVMYLLETLTFCFKILPFLTNGNRIKTCINYFSDLRFAPKDEEEVRMVNECIRICKRNSLVYFLAMATSASLWILPVLLAGSYKLPIDVWLPFDFKRNPFVFYITFICICTAMVYEGSVGTMIDPLVGGLAYHATGQLKILKYNLQYLDGKVKVQTFVQSEHLRRNLALCIEHYNDILNFVREFENCFAWPVFCQFTASLLGLCFSLIGLIAGTAASIDGMKNLICVIFIPLQVLFYCHYGTLLFEENNGLINAIYMGQWYTYDVGIRRMLIIIMERSKKPLIITSGKVINLTLQTFASVVKMSYSLIAVFNKYS